MVIYKGRKLERHEGHTDNENSAIIPHPQKPWHHKAVAMQMQRKERGAFYTSATLTVAADVSKGRCFPNKSI